jgi:crossover junction endodeoxyribonuclease RuvC
VIILGVDPGLANTGFGAINCNSVSASLLKCGSIKTSQNTHISNRLLQIYDDMKYLIDTINPDIVAIENVFSLVRYPRAGILLGGVLGVIYLLVSQRKLKVVEITPKEVKNALVGYGSANKKQVSETIQKTLHMGEIKSLHASDALAIALTAFYRESSLRLR